MNRLVAALLRADRPGAADVRSRRLQGVVLPLALGRADGMAWRQVEDVEPHLLHFGKNFYYFRKRTKGTREQLVPGGEARVDRIDNDLEDVLVRLDTGGVGFSLQQLADLEIHRQVLARLLALLEVALPGEVGIGPAAHRVLVAPKMLDRERRAPVIVAKGSHRHDPPVFFRVKLE